MSKVRLCPGLAFSRVARWGLWVVLKAMYSPLTSLRASCCLVANSFPTLLRPHGLYPTRLLHPWHCPGKNTEVGSHLLLQGIFPPQGLNLCLLNISWISRPLLYHWATREALGHIRHNWFAWCSIKILTPSLLYGNTRPPDLPPEKSVCRSGSNS